MNPLIIGAVGIGALMASAAAIPAINYDSSDDTDNPMSDLYPSTTPDPNAQINAFLAVIRAGESSNNYYAKVGGGNIASLATYPTWAGVGNSHAVGAYQFEPQTWRECATALGLSDFGVASQDAAAVYLLKRRGAYNAIVNGDIPTACDLLKNEWQIFTLPRWNSDVVAQSFTSNGGVTA